MVKILLTSDLHLGINPENSTCKYENQISTLKKIVKLACEHDILLIAGDFLDSININKQMIISFQTILSELSAERTKLILAPGINEIYGERNKSILHLLSSEHVISELNESAPYSLELNNQKIYIYGTSPNKTEQKIFEVQKQSADGFHLGLFYSNNTQILNLIQQRFNQNAMTALDFYAVGGIHNFNIARYGEKITAAIPGSPETIQPEETGERYALSLTIDNNSLQQLKRITVNTITHMHEKISCEEIAYPDQIENMLKEKASQTINLTLTFEGKRDFALSSCNFENYKNIFSDLKIVDLSEPSIEALIEEFSQEDSFRGEFFTLLKDTLSNNSKNISREHLKILVNILTSNNSITEELLCNLINA